MPLLMSIFLIFIVQISLANCLIFKSDFKEVSPQSDALYMILKNNLSCPLNVKSFKMVLSSLGLESKPSMVANRGIHNSQFGSFSFFEEVIGEFKISSKNDPNTVIKNGEFFFGHFTTLEDGNINLDDKPAPNKLLIELISWDLSEKGI